MVENNYLIVDLAHIFKYTGVPRQVSLHNNETGTDLIYDYHVLYLGYLGEEQIEQGYYSRAIIGIDFLEITPDNIITWIDKAIGKGYILPDYYITGIFAEPIENI
jgi:hypothetical protein